MKSITCMEGACIRSAVKNVPIAKGENKVEYKIYFSAKIHDIEPVMILR